MTRAPLANCGVLLTRPAQQTVALKNALLALGATPFIFPCLVITPLSPSNQEQQFIQKLTGYDGIIFTSQHAVTHSAPLIKAHWPLWPEGLPLFAVGKQTANAITAVGWPYPIHPELAYTTESLLELANFANPNQQRFLLVTGANPRPVLTHELALRGAHVDTLTVYQRSCPQVDPTWLLDQWAQDHIQVTVSFSGESLANLVSILGDAGKDYWRNTPLLVISSRIQALAIQLGVRHDPLVASNASDEAVINALLQWRIKGGR